MAKTYNEVAQQLPADAKWSCSFGYPGEGGYTEFQRDAAGNKYVIQNGQFGDEWTIKQEPK